MSQFFATFPAGTYEIIAKHLKGFQISEVRIIDHDKSSVLLQSSLPVERLIELRYFTNVYRLTDKQNPLSKTAMKGKYFRLMRIKNGEPHSIEPTQRAKLETEIRRDYNLEPNTHLARNDFYLIERSSGKKLLGLRLPKAKFKREKLAAGKLRPELAHILCLAAGIKAKHIVLDPFAGYGSIPYEAVRGFGCKEVVAVDNQELSNRHKHPAIKWYKADASNLNFLADNSIDRIVTDPPWGIYESRLELPSLYEGFTQEIQCVLKQDGVAIVLTGYGKAADYFKQAKNLKSIGKWDVLVSGKKASIYKLQKLN